MIPIGPYGLFREEADLNSCGPRNKHVILDIVEVSPESLVDTKQYQST